MAKELGCEGMWKDIPYEGRFFRGSLWIFNHKSIDRPDEV